MEVKRVSSFDAARAISQAVAEGAGTWREVAQSTGISYERVRQLGKQIGVAPCKAPVNRPQRRRRRKPAWNEPKVVDRFWAQVNLDGPLAFGFAEPTRCWVWQGRTNAEGYGVLSVGRLRVSAHRYSYRLHHGKKPWSVVDHLCHSYSRDCRGGPSCQHRLCVNPEHFEVVTPTENSRRVPGNRVYTEAPPRLFAWCRNGHAWNPDDALYDAAGRRVCVWCITGMDPPDREG